MVKEVFGKKIGMTQIFGEDGQLFPVTIVEIEPACLLERFSSGGKELARIGSFQAKKKKRLKVKVPQQGYFNKIGTPFFRIIKEVEVDLEAEKEELKKQQAEKQELDEKQTKEKEDDQSQKQSKKNQTEDEKETKGEAAQDKQNSGSLEEASSKAEEQVEADAEEIKKEAKTSDKAFSYFGIEIFKQGEKVTVKAKSKGKGFAGAVKRHSTHRQPSSHGSGMHRRVGSVGASATPSKIMKNKKMPGRLGSSNVSTKNLEILRIDKENRIVFIKGSIPGSRSSVIRVIKQNNKK